MSELITQAEFARRHGVSRQAVNDWVTRGVIALTDGKLDEASALAAMAAVADPAREQRILISAPDGFSLPQTPAGDSPGEPPTPEESSSFHAAKTRREHAEATMAEMKLAERRGELVLAESVKAGAEEAAKSTRNAMLGIPDRCASLLAAESDVARVHAILLNEIKQALHGLADRLSADAQ